MIYVQEDESVRTGVFGGASGRDASIGKLDPRTGKLERIAEMDRSAVVPAGTTDSGGGDLGNWEPSGVLDVTKLFFTVPGERLLIADVQAHGIRDGVIGADGLEQGGKLLFLTRFLAPGRAPRP